MLENKQYAKEIEKLENLGRENTSQMQIEDFNSMIHKELKEKEEKQETSKTEHVKEVVVASTQEEKVEAP